MKTHADLIQDIDSCTPGPGQLAFWWLGQLGFVLKLGGTVIYIDAYLQDRPERLIKPLLAPGEITHADYVFGTHDHSDHIDRPNWPQLAANSPQARFIVPRRLVPELSASCLIPTDRLIGVNDDGTAIRLAGTAGQPWLQVTAVAAAHEWLDQDAATGEYPYLGYLIEGNGLRIYHAGDCCVYEGLLSKLQKLAPVDLMILPINGRDGVRFRANCIGNMTFQEAVDLAGAIKPGLVVPAHYDMFRHNLGDPLAFFDYLEAKYPSVPCWIGGHGERAMLDNRARMGL